LQALITNSVYIIFSQSELRSLHFVHRFASNLDIRKTKEHENAESHIIKSFIICTMLIWLNVKDEMGHITRIEKMRYA